MSNSPLNPAYRIHTERLILRCWEPKDAPLAALTRVAFEVNQKEWVEIHCSPDNVRSAAVPRKLGYTHEATLRRRDRSWEDAPRDFMIWSLFADEYRASPAASAEIAAYDVAGYRIL